MTRLYATESQNMKNINQRLVKNDQKCHEIGKMLNFGDLHVL